MLSVVITATINQDRNMIRKIPSIAAGYTIFVVTSLTFFKFLGHASHAKATTLFIILAAISDAAFSLFRLEGSH